MIAADRYYIEVKAWPRRRLSEIVARAINELLSLLLGNPALFATIRVRLLERGTDVVVMERRFVARGDAEAWRESMTAELRLPLDAFQRKFAISQ